VSINRRTAIRQLAFISAGAALLPSCFHDQNDNDDQQRLLEELTATIIPTTDTPGAKEAAAHLFVARMMNDCATAGDRIKFQNGHKAFDAAATKLAGKGFVQCTPAQRESLLSAIEGKKMPDADLNFFYFTTKRLTILAYSSSQYYLTKVQVYELVPGRWHGCVPVKAQGGQAS
jgi:hypothetical protein